MKKLLSLALALFFSMAVFAQDAYWENFENPTGWSFDQPNQDVNWEIGDIFDNGDNCAYAATTNIAIYAPAVTLTSADIADGSLEFYLLTALAGTAGPETSSVSLIVVVDQDVRLISIGELSSSTGWRLVNVTFAQLAQYAPALNITSGSKTVTFGVVHTSNTNGCYLILDDFKIRKRSNAFVVKFNPTDGTGTMNDMVTDENAGLTAPTCTFTAPAGKKFAYWYAIDNNENQYTMFEGDEIEDLDQDFYFYAIWGSTFTVNYNANGGTGNMAAGTGVQFVGYTVLDNAFTRQGYTFTGWNTKADGTGDDYAPGDNLENMDGEGELIATSITLYAQWAEGEGGGQGGQGGGEQGGGQGEGGQGGGTSAINSVSMANISIYPNPAQNMIRVNGASINSLEVMDLTGRKVLRNEGVNTIDLSGLNNGVYMLRINANEGVAVRKIVKK